MTPQQLSIIFFLQVAVILAVSRLVGDAVQRWLNQPRVVGEMIAGVLLGPSLFGALAPAAQAWLFPPETQAVLYVFAQFGVGLYMFIIGLGFDRQEFASNARGAAAISIAGMVIPFITAAAFAPWLIEVDGLFAPTINTLQAGLFLGAALAITAFPMLARIIHERGIAGSTMGTLSLSAGAIGDAGSWALIAILLATLGDGSIFAIRAVAGGMAFALLMTLVAPRLLKALARASQADGTVPDAILALVLIYYAVCAWLMDSIGIHAVFGGFLLGTAMPRGPFSANLRQKLEPLTLTLLLPFFFTYSGLHTQLLQVMNGPMLLIAIAILLASIISKGGASYCAARWCGQDHRSAAGIGILMNARGLMELIILNIGLQRGIIGPALFSMLVLMAIVTTLMTSPLFEWSQRRAATASPP